MIRFLIAFLVAAMVAPTVAADVTVADDVSLRRAMRAARPGDVIKMSPGKYAGGIYETILGEKDKRITIEAADPKDQPLFEGGPLGMHLPQSRYVTLRNLRFRGHSGGGLNLDDGGKRNEPAVGIVLEGITVTDIGPRGNYDGIKCSGLSDLIIRNCTIEGWGGSAIDFVGCSKALIEGCTFRGKKGFSQSTGPQFKGGSSEIVIRDCRFDNAGTRGINCGGSTGMKFFRPPNATYEAKDILIEKCVFIGGDAPVAFVGVDGAVFRENTIIDPERFVLRILQETTDARFNPCRNVTFEKNLIVYKKAELIEVVNIGPDTAPETFKFKNNWWYCRDDSQARPKLPSKETAGIYGQDPKLELGKDGFPTNPPGAPLAAGKAK